MDQVGGIAEQKTAFVECLADERDISLPQVAHPAVDQLRAPARCPVSKVEGFEQERPVPPRGRVDGRSQPGGPAADDHKVPDRWVAQSLEVFAASQ